MKAVAVVGNPKAASRTHDAVERVRTADVVTAACPTYKGAYTGLLELCPAQGLCQLDSSYLTDDSPARWTGRWGPTVPNTAKARTAR
ncbi:hypothetical protein [Streptomyces sp. NPDC002763]|uniref:hypothetical protein n=1 Tax=Streptomyces sp. NPDC002763 TaxID=3154427 RepID=UPI003333E049